MLFKRVESEGLAQYSYLIADRGEALVIDPRRDCDAYIEEASREGCRIQYILETHRHEDFVLGSLELADRTGAGIWHADGELPYRYGVAVEDGTTWKVGRFKVEAMHTPGHTPGSMSYVLHEAGGHPWMVFTGDTLFSGDVGRVDLLGVEQMVEMARLLHGSIFDRLYSLGDGVIVCPGHGAGSVCGIAIADRPWTTIGLERRLNPKLKYADRGEFAAHVAMELERPPYFLRMEKLNVEGPPLLKVLPDPPPLPPQDFFRKAKGSQVVDTRMELAFGAAHVPGALSIWQGGLSGFAGWFVSYEKPILLVTETNDPLQAVRPLIRLGYDDIVGSLSGGMLSWHMAGLATSRIGTIPVQDLCRILDEHRKVWLLDVRSEEELEKEGRITNAHHIHITQVPFHLRDIPQDEPVYIFCGSGLRSMITASFLQKEGWRDITVVLGGLAGWRSVSCPVRQE